MPLVGLHMTVYALHYHCVYGSHWFPIGSFFKGQKVKQSSESKGQKVLYDTKDCTVVINSMSSYLTTDTFTDSFHQVNFIDINTRTSTT